MEARRAVVKNIANDKTLFGNPRYKTAHQINNQLKKQGYTVTDRTVRNDLNAVAPGTLGPAKSFLHKPKIKEEHVTGIIEGTETSYAAAQRLNRQGFKVTAPGLRAAVRRITSNKTGNYEEK